MPLETVYPIEEARLVDSTPAFPVLRHHRTLSAAPINRWRSVLFGLPFISAGALIALVSVGRIPARKYAPDGLLAAIAAIFIGGGLVFLVHGIRDLRRRAIWRQQSAARPGEPWLADYAWHRDGVAFFPLDEMLQRLLAALGWTFVLTLMGWLGAREPDGWPIWAALSFFSLCCLLLWAWWAASVLELRRYGSSYLKFSEFPFRLGGELHARLSVPRNLSRILQLSVTLRCIQEQYVTRGSGSQQTVSIICYERYKDVILMNASQLAWFGRGEVPIEFPLPAEQAGTELSAAPPTYWEIEVRGRARGADYEAFFLVPIYDAR